MSDTGEKTFWKYNMWLGVEKISNNPHWSYGGLDVCFSDSRPEFRSDRRLNEFLLFCLTNT